MKTTPAHPTDELRRSIATLLSAKSCEEVGPRAALLRALTLIFDEKLLRASKAIQLPTTGRDSSNQSIAAVLIKPVSDLCNLRCSYCYEGEVEQRFKSRKISPKLLERIIIDACEQADREIAFLWHGGEPLLAGISLFEHGVRVQKLHSRKNLRIVNAVQTNGMLLNNEWLRFFRQENFSVGLSLDGPPELNDVARYDANGRGTANKVEDAIGRLQDEKVPFGIISVIGPQHVGRGDTYLRYFLGLGVSNLDIHPNVRLSDETVVGMSSASFASFCIELFESWLEAGDVGLRINLFDDFFRGYFGLNPETCYFSGNCSRVIAVEASGEVVPCTRPFDRSQFTFGSLARDSLHTIQNSHAINFFARLDREGQYRSNACKWHYLCHAGCPQHRGDASGKQRVNFPSLYCDCEGINGGGYAAVWDHMASRLYDMFVDGHAKVLTISRRTPYWLKPDV
ncbi:radical SAM/SPASM domain-containing protein [Achromobacter xylosoxidans]|uniref:radical SAM/SPASM domain-containing protein n=1 Tax=Alcaligenes xylosoxydans xylosoxydans TaxID=85698 RepID=UPI000B49610D|nr:radical SAM protein [Achromobacter xylosoxidans]